MEILKRVGWNIKRLRAERGVTQENLATDGELDRGYLSGIERGVRNPAVLSLEKIARALKVDVAELFDEAAAKSFAKTFRKR